MGAVFILPRGQNVARSGMGHFDTLIARDVVWMVFTRTTFFEVRGEEIRSKIKCSF